jgi:3-oxoacyl-[acyl-carrier-protein] synthase II
MGESAVFEAAPVTGTFDLRSAAGYVFARTVADRLELTGPRRTFGTACAAGNYAIGAAHRAVAAGRVDIALAGGVEPFSRIAMLGFARMRAMAPDGCRPFAPARRGMTLGEGAAFVVVESREHAAARGAMPLARIGGLGLAADAHHPTAPREDGSGMAAAMRAGLKAAEVSPGDVGWVSAHGTGTPRSDSAEALALHEVFGPSVPPVSSAKGAIGHTLGAATAVEAVLSVLALRDGVLPPNGGVDACDEGLDLDVVLAARPSALYWVMSCGYAFGGLNSALLLGRP